MTDGPGVQLSGDRAPREPAGVPVRGQPCRSATTAPDARQAACRGSLRERRRRCRQTGRPGRLHQRAVRDRRVPGRRRDRVPGRTDHQHPVRPGPAISICTRRPAADQRHARDRARARAVARRHGMSPRLNAGPVPRARFTDNCGPHPDGTPDCGGNSGGQPGEAWPPDNEGLITATPINENQTAPNRRRPRPP